MQEPKRTRVAIYFRMFSPYILARINAAADRLDVVGIEGSRRSAVYAWEPREGEERFDRQTLFVNGAIEDKASAEIVAATIAALDAADPDVVCVTGWSHSEALAMLGWACKHRRRVIILSESTAHDSARVGWREQIKRQIVQLGDAALVGGKPQTEYIAALGMPRDRVFLGYDAVDNAFFARGADLARADAAATRAALELPERYFLVSCRFIEKKNLARLIDAFAAYRRLADEAAWDLVLLGDGELRPALEQQVQRLGLGDAVHFKGFQQYDALPSYYGLAGGFVHVSVVEQWGLVVNEAMAAGLPVIVSQPCGCVEDLVEDGVNGWVVDPLDTAEITARLASLSAAGTDRAAMAERSRAIVANYGPDRFGDGLVRAIDAANRNAPRRAGVFARWLLRKLAARNTRDGS